MTNVYCPDLAPRKSKVWTPQRTRALLSLVEQCGPNLCRTIMAIDIGIPGAARERIVAKKLRELKIEGTRI